MQAHRTDEDARRTYWAEQMEAAYGFMQVMMDYPVAECGDPMGSLREAAAEARVTVLFSETKIAGQFERLFYLRKGLIRSFIGAARDMNERGWTLKVEDGYRSRAMQKGVAMQPIVLDRILAKAIWETGGKVPEPDFLFRRITALSATFPKIGTHMSGSALDISVIRAEDGSEVDRGGSYIELSEKTPMETPFVPPQAARNRAEITRIMRRHGFMAYPWEFWHYSQGDAYAEHLANTGRPARYGAVDFDPAAGSLAAIPNPKDSLHSPKDILRNMHAALARLANSLTP
jgi:D-alanyl-D-alanine dipeptidase